MNENQFDEKWGSTLKIFRFSFIAVIIMWILGVLLSLALTGGLVYVAIHFISKYW